MFTGLKGRDYYERLKHLNLWTQEERENTKYLFRGFKMYTPMDHKNETCLFCDNSGKY